MNGKVNNMPAGPIRDVVIVGADRWPPPAGRWWGFPTVSDQAPWLWSDQGDLNIQTAGAPDAAGRIVGCGDLTGPDGAALLQIAGDRLVGAITLNRGSDVAVTRRLIVQEKLAFPAFASSPLAAAPHDTAQYSHVRIRQ